MKLSYSDTMEGFCFGFSLKENRNWKMLMFSTGSVAGVGGKAFVRDKFSTAGLPAFILSGTTIKKSLLEPPSPQNQELAFPPCA